MAVVKSTNPVASQTTTHRSSFRKTILRQSEILALTSRKQHQSKYFVPTAVNFSFQSLSTQPKQQHANQSLAKSTIKQYLSLKLLYIPYNIIHSLILSCKLHIYIFKYHFISKICSFFNSQILPVIYLYQLYLNYLFNQIKKKKKFICIKCRQFQKTFINLNL